MNKEQLNNLVISYQGGNEEALNDIFRTVSPLVERASEDLEGIVNDVTKFDCRILLKVKNLADDFSEETRDFLSIVKTLISKEKSDFIKRRSKHLEEVSLEYLETPKENDLGFQLKDPLAGIEDKVLFKEKVTLLAQGDQRRNKILTEWSKGTNDKGVSLMLAHQLGGNPESHRKFITRFKTECCNRLESEVSN